MHSTEPPSVQFASVAHDVVGTVPRKAQQNMPLAPPAQRPPQAAPLPDPPVVPLLEPPPPLLLELEPVVVLPLLLELELVVVLPLLLELGPVGPVDVFDPQPPEASASAVATAAPIDAKNSTCAFLMGKP